MAYIRRARTERGCLFCRVSAAGGRSDRAQLVLARRPHGLLMLNRYPYNPAHLMVAPARHVGAVARLTAAERADVLELTALAERALAAEYRPHGLNLGANLGRVAGAGYPGHFHLHLVPRWNGDTNFMPTVGATRVLPESLARTWSRLRRALATLSGRGGRLRTAGGGRRASTPAGRVGGRRRAPGAGRGRG
jgi:ATP adenylyltransferase